MAVYSVISQRLPGPEIAIYAAMLRFFAIFGLPDASIQIVMAQDTARAITPEDHRKLRATIRAVVQGPDGYLYLLTDESDGAILRLQPGR